MHQTCPDSPDLADEKTAGDDQVETRAGCEGFDPVERPSSAEQSGAESPRDDYASPDLPPKSRPSSPDREQDNEGVATDSGTGATDEGKNRYQVEDPGVGRIPWRS